MVNDYDLTVQEAARRAGISPAMLLFLVWLEPRLLDYSKLTVTILLLCGMDEMAMLPHDDAPMDSIIIWHLKMTVRNHPDITPVEAMRQELAQLVEDGYNLNEGFTDLFSDGGC